MLNKLLKKLPEELLNYIKFLTFKPQNKNLLLDIENYVLTNKYLRNMYYMRIIVHNNLKSPKDLEWLSNDIYAFLNKNQALMDGYIDEFYEIFKRKSNLKTKKQIEKFLYKMNKQTVSFEINIFLGIINKYERIKLINYCLDKDYLN